MPLQLQKCARSSVLSVDANLPFDPTTEEHRPRREEEHAVKEAREDIEGRERVEEERARGGGRLWEGNEGREEIDRLHKVPSARASSEEEWTDHQLSEEEQHKRRRHSRRSRFENPRHAPQDIPHIRQNDTPNQHQSDQARPGSDV